MANAYGTWDSQISAQAVARGATGFSDLQSVNGTRYWLESLPQEGGRVAAFSHSDGQTQLLTPAPFNVRSRVHEYGGSAMLACESGVWFVNAIDQNIYFVDAALKITQLTRGDSQVRFSSLALDREHQRLISVAEIHNGSQTRSSAHAEPQNVIAAISLDDGDMTILHQGHDFYADPALSADSRLAFIAWDHPNMPWDGTLLYVAEQKSDGVLINATVVAGGAQESVVQPTWTATSDLIFISDATGYWNPYVLDASGIRSLLTDEAEYAGPLWQLGARDIAEIGPGHLVAVRRESGRSELVLIDTNNGFSSPLTDAYCGYTDLTCHAGQVLFVAQRNTQGPAIVELDPADGTHRILRETPQAVDAHLVSEPEHIAFPTRDGRRCYAYLYRPFNPSVPATALPRTEKPPVMLLSHGGPTGSTSSALNLKVQYFTSRGWMVIDVNYRGSTGYGRSYRDALQGNWGVLDVTDSEDAINYLIVNNLIDPTRVALRGGSAGGFTTLAALTSTATFKAGAVYYGIGNLKSLADDTHKFESRYLEGLLGDELNLDARSPIHHIDQLNCPVIFFQGGEDRVVPPNQAEEMVKVLRTKGIKVRYVYFENEGHGFRDGHNIAQAINDEYEFLCEAFAIETPGDTTL
ncbi:MAG: prolyl oligopeptidase family serine peptidase [Proteobacteria bacterium]|nr:prolyl oligopeptidase family serine peptidase [Pseudomonadota bacterium]